MKKPNGTRRITKKCSVKDQNSAESEKISAKIEELSGLIDKLNYRLNLLVAAVLNIFLLWDIRQIMAIEDWKKNNHQNFDIAFDALAEYEALVSLSSLAANYADWCTPEIVDNESYTFVAKDLGHPLISIKKRVENDFTNWQILSTSISLPAPTWPARALFCGLSA